MISSTLCLFLVNWSITEFEHLMKLSYMIPLEMELTPPKFDSSPLKNDGWKMILSFWDVKFSGAMLVLGRVIRLGKVN